MRAVVALRLNQRESVSEREQCRKGRLMMIEGVFFIFLLVFFFLPAIRFNEEMTFFSPNETISVTLSYIPVSIDMVLCFPIKHSLH